MANLDNLADDMIRLSVRIDSFAKQTVQDVSLSILSDLVQVTPADVGTALSNWQLTLDAPAEHVLTAYVSSPRGKMVKGIWTHKVDPVLTAQANVAPTLDAAKVILAGRQKGQLVFITNNLPYIRTLDGGSSEQAPVGFVDRAVILGNQAVQAAKL
jgi:hypothetical protein